MKTRGFFWHVHHDKLAEWSDDINERIAYIKNEKPEEERALRLKLLKPVMGKLPAKFLEAWEDYDKAREDIDKAKEDYVKAREDRDKAREAYGKAWEDYVKAREAYDKAREDLDKAWEACEKELEALHRIECPDCPWTGSSIFK